MYVSRKHCYEYILHILKQWCESACQYGFGSWLRFGAVSRLAYKKFNSEILILKAKDQKIRLYIDSWCVVYCWATCFVKKCLNVSSHTAHLDSHHCVSSHELSFLTTPTTCRCIYLKRVTKLQGQLEFMNLCFSKLQKPDF